MAMGCPATEEFVVLVISFSHVRRRVQRDWSAAPDGLINLLLEESVDALVER